MTGLLDSVKAVLTERYDDPFNEKISGSATFEDVWIALCVKKDIYKVLGFGDSIIREHAFEVLSEILECDYDLVYLVWLYGYEHGTAEYRSRAATGKYAISA